MNNKFYNSLFKDLKSYDKYLKKHPLHELFGLNLKTYGPIKKKIKKSIYYSVNPKLKVSYSVELDDMLPHRYGQVAVFDENECIAISGFWIGNKLWVGKYLELDNIIVLEKYRSQGIGKLMFDFWRKKQRNSNVTCYPLIPTPIISVHISFFITRDMLPEDFIL